MRKFRLLPNKIIKSEYVGKEYTEEELVKEFKNELPEVDDTKPDWMIYCGLAEEIRESSVSKMKLISMKSFVLEQTKHIPYVLTANIRFQGLVIRYATFLNQPLTLGMFVPCDDLGNVINEPPKIEEAQYDWEIYQQAKERVLFEFIGKDPIGRKSKGLFFRGTVFFKIEDLTIFNDFTLTESAIKQIGL